MNSLQDLSKIGSHYFVIKTHQWRGNLRRLLVIESQNVATFELSEYKMTNIYPCHEIKEFHPITNDEDSNTVTTGADQFFSIGFPNNRMKFKSKFRSDILTDLFKVCPNIYPRYSENVKRYNVLKRKWNGENYKVVLEIGLYAVNKINAKTNHIMSSYEYRDIYRLIHIKDCDSGPGFVISTTENEHLHLFIMNDSNSCQEVLERIRLIARRNIGVVLPISNEPIKYHSFQESRFGISSSLAVLPIHVFTVQKIKFAADNVEMTKKITLACTDHYLLERDSNSNELINIRSLTEVYAIVRPKEHSQKFAILFVNGYRRYYTSTERDSLLASLLDSVRSSGNANVFIKLDFYHNKIVSQPEIDVARFINSRYKDLPQAMEFFIQNSFFLNSNTIESKRDKKEHEKYIQGAINELLFEEICDNPCEQFNSKLLVLKNLFSTRPGFSYFILDKKFKSVDIEQLFKKVKKAFDSENDVVIFTAIDMLSTLMQPVYDENDLFFEQRNKGFLLSSQNFLPIILDLMQSHIMKGTGALIISAILDFLTYALCAPYSETTDGNHFDILLNLLSKYGRCLFKLFSHQSLSIVKATCLLMKAMIEEGNAQIAQEMQKLALAEGTFLYHLNASLFPIVTREKFLPIQILSRKLISLWTVNNEITLKILRNIFPLGLLNYFESKESPPSDSMAMNARDNLKIAQDISTKPVSGLQKIRDQYSTVRIVERHIENAFNHWRKRIGIVSASETPQDNPIVLRRRRELIKSSVNWNMFFYQFTQNHSKPDLIWNHKTREELREALEKEISFLKNEKELHSTQLLSWNFIEFEVNYCSLNEELKIGDYYLRLLLSQGSSDEDNKLNDRLYIKSPVEFFNDLYHRFLSNSNISMQADCLQAMTIIYDKYHEEIGSFNDINFIMDILKKCTHRNLRDRIVQLVGKIIKNESNIRILLRSDGLFTLIDLATLSHLHVNRAVIPTQTNVIEASPEMSRDSFEKEWHISQNESLSFADLKKLWEEGKISSETKCWAQGYNSWKKVSEIPQLKWSFLAGGISIFQENNMTIYILNTLIKICEVYPSRSSDNSIIRPIPKVKQILSDENCLPHIVHLLLTFDPIIVEKIATLLYLIIEDNPRISLLYQTGMFYFILMYTGSNILPISRILHLTHMKQSFRSDDNQKSSVLQRSVLSSMLPEAMVCFLENYGPDEFSKVFLGEFDTPEVIWNSEMRRFMIEKISAHIVDFSPRLHSNVRAIYQYCPIPPIQYQQLENELFCTIYYLKNLCDTKRFADWKIKDPVTFLRDILEMWKVEIEKKPNSMQVEDALEILGIKDYDGPLKGPEFESIIRKRYYTQAQRYHPDKNSDGREMFEKVNEAYYFLFSSTHKSNGPDVQNIMLILKTQSILFSRYNVELYQYKYAGYPMLLKTIQLELNDQYLFSKTDSLLAHACKTVYYTVKCSALNAEELRRENGLQMLYDILNRCVGVLSNSSLPKHLCTKVCKHIISTFGVSAEFPACRLLFYEMPSISKNIFYVLNYKHLTKLCMAAIDCIIYFSNDPYLQLLLFKAGCLFSLIQFIFKYDYTLEENEKNLEANEKNSKQFVTNSLAKKSLSACVALFENRFDQARIEDKSLLDDYSMIRQAIYALLTPFIANQLNMANVPELLKLINSNIENPYFIWNNASRAELLNYLQNQERELLRSGVCMDESYGSQFVYSCHKEELIISDIFVRIYNKQPNYPLNNVKKFVIDLLDNIGSHAQYLHSINAISLKVDGDENVSIDDHRIKTLQECLTALINLLDHNVEIENCFVGHFRNIFSLLRLDSYPDVQALVLKLLIKLSSNKECINDISNSNVFLNLLLMLHVSYRINETTSKPYLDILDIMMSFITNSDLVKEGISKGLILYVLYLFIMPNHVSVREKAAQLLIKICSDVLNGQYSNWVMSQFLPALFLNAMKDAPQNAINLYDENKENPELIWTDESRQKLNKHIKTLVDDLYSKQLANSSHTWKFAAGDEFKCSIDDEEFKISGVYLRLFNKSPGWILSRPKDFLLDLLEYVKKQCDKPDPNDEKMEMVNDALHSLLSTQPDLLILIPPTGYIPIFINKLKSNNLTVSKTCLSLIQKFSLNPSCTSDMINTNKLAENFNFIIETHPNLIELLCDTLVKIFDYKSEEFINQAIKHGLITNLLKVLESKASQSTKAKIVQMFQSVLDTDPNSPISEILNNSNIWKDYKDQKHDLFISSSNASNHLTNSSMNIAGYLKQSSGKTLPLVPPPIEE